LKKIFLEVCGSISERKLSFTPSLVRFLMSMNSPIKNSTFYYHSTVWALHFFCGHAPGFVFASAAIWCQLLVLHEPLPDVWSNSLSWYRSLAVSAHENDLFSYAFSELCPKHDTGWCHFSQFFFWEFNGAGATPKLLMTLETQGVANSETPSFM